MTEYNAGWGKITYKNQTGYISRGYVQKTTDKVSGDSSSTSTNTNPSNTNSTAQKVTTGYITATSLNVRSASNNTSKILGTL